MSDDSDNEKTAFGEFLESIDRQHSPTQEGMGPLLVEIGQRCKSASIEIDPTDIQENTKRVLVKLPSGREKREILIRDKQSAELLLSIHFEQVHGVAGYRAYCSYQDGYIESMLDAGRTSRLPVSSTYSRLNHLLRRGRSEDDEDESSRVEFSVDDERLKGVSLSIGPATRVFAVLETLRMGRLYLIASRPSIVRPYTIKLEGVSISRNEQASDLLEKVANSALLQVDLLAGVPLYLAAEEEGVLRPRRTAPKRDEVKLTFPKYQYGSKPMSLYWYARTATGMPLLQYLAYYQVVEFYFPVFAERATHEIVQRVMKDPSFDSNRDENISQFLGMLKPFLAKGGYGDERATLLATIRECVSEQEFRAFFNEDKDRFEFFKTKSQVITSSKVSVDRENADLVTEVASRIYEIRCKTVHTKVAEGNRPSDLLLPFSKEAQQLGFDIELVQFVARKVLIASGTPITL